MASRGVGTRAKTRAMVSGLIGIAAGLVSALYVPWEAAPIIGWDAAAIIFIIWVWTTILSLDEVATADHALSEDPTRTTADIILLGTSLISLAAVALVLIESHHSSGSAQAWLAFLGAGSVVLSWVVVHTIYTLRYAMLYYGHPRGGIDFGGETAPAYADFAYLAFTIGMTFQVSDTTFTTRTFRRMALRHSLFAYVFGTIIIATTLNLVINLGS